MDKIKAKKTAMFLIILTLLITLASSVFAIGVAPARKIIDFSPGKTSVDLLIINNENKELQAVILAKGELSQYITFKQTLIKLSAEEGSRKISYDINLPENIGNPGTHGAEIVIIELPKEFEKESSTAIGAVGAVESQLQVRVPYPGNYAEAKIYVSENDANKPAIFTIQMYNLGIEDIKSAKAEIEILGATYERIATIQTDEISVKSNQEGKLSGQWIANVNPGVYHLVAVIDYDGKKIRLEENFNVGKLTVEIKKIEVNDFHLGGVAKFDIYLENKWNELIPGVYGDLTVMDKKGSIITKFRTEPVDLKALSESKMRAYWDTEGVSAGVYDINIVLNYAGKTSERLFEIEVNLDSIRAKMPTAQVISTKGGANKESILVIMVIVLIIINIGWLVYLKKRKR